MKLLYVVHRYYPYPGGSEYYVQAMAEESLKRGHTVTVFTGEHKGDQNGVKVTSDPNILMQSFDLIIVHGDSLIQNIVLSKAEKIPNSILYLLIYPSDSPVCVHGLKYCKYLGWSTLEDLDHIHKYYVSDKAVNIRHGIKKDESYGKPGFRKKYGIKTKKMFISCGGFSPHKAMPELVESFKKAGLKDTTLVLTGYENHRGLMPKQEENILPLLIDDKQEVMNGIYEADLYILNSHSEGFGLVLLESMINNTPWIARYLAGSHLMKDYGKVYENENQLIELLQNFDYLTFDLEKSHDYIMNNHLISNTVDDIEKILRYMK